MLTNRSKQKAIESAKPNAVSALPVVVSLKRPFARRVPLDLNAAAAEAAADAAAQAREGFAVWSAWPHRRRRKRLLAVKRELYRRRDEFIELISAETGKPAFEALLHEVFPALGHLDFFARHAARMLRPRNVRRRSLLHKRYRIHRVPRGVIGVISPCNFPMLIPLGDIAAALAAGNAVVFKPSERCPRLGRAIASLFESLPAGTVTLLEGGAAEARALVAAEGSTGKAKAIDGVTFTGGEQAGREIARLAAARLIPCTLELGGNNPALVLADADIARAADAVAFAAFANSGQMCAAVGLVLVEQQVAEEFTANLIERAHSLRLEGNKSEHEQSAWDMSGRLMGSGIARMESLVTDAIAAGADVACGGEAVSRDGEHFWPPTIITGVTPRMRIAREEIFGPVVPVIEVASEPEAIEIANDSDYGLSAYVFSKDRRRARRVAKQLRAGTVVINDGPHTVGESSLPWGSGGGGRSGLGRVHGESGFLAFTAEKVVSEPLVAVPGGELWNFPYDARKLAKVRGLTRLRFGGSLWERLGGLWELLFGGRG